MPETTTLLVSIILIFVSGVVGGWLASKRAGGDAITKSHLQVAVGIVVTVVWMIAVVAEIFIPAYTVSVLIHGIMGAVVGYLFSKEGLNFTIGGE